MDNFKIEYMTEQEQEYIFNCPKCNAEFKRYWKRNWLRIEPLKCEKCGCEFSAKITYKGD